MTDLTRQLRGREVASVETNGHILAIRMQDGAEILIKWVDHNGETIKGRPVVGSKGFRMKMKAQEIAAGVDLGIPN